MNIKRTLALLSLPAFLSLPYFIQDLAANASNAKPPSNQVVVWLKTNEVFITMTLTIGGAVGGALVYATQKVIHNQQELGRLKFMDTVSTSLFDRLAPRLESLDSRIEWMQREFATYEKRLAMLSDRYHDLRSNQKILLAMRSDVLEKMDRVDKIDAHLSITDDMYGLSSGFGNGPSSSGFRKPDSCELFDPLHSINDESA